MSELLRLVLTDRSPGFGLLKYIYYFSGNLDTDVMKTCGVTTLTNGTPSPGREMQLTGSDDTTPSLQLSSVDVFLSPDIAALDHIRAPEKLRPE